MSKHWVMGEGLLNTYAEVRGTLSDRAEVVLMVQAPVREQPGDLPQSQVVLTPEGARRVAALLTDLAQQVEDFNKMQEEWT